MGRGRGGELAFFVVRRNEDVEVAREDGGCDQEGACCKVGCSDWGDSFSTRCLFTALEVRESERMY